MPLLFEFHNIFKFKQSVRFSIVTTWFDSLLRDTLGLGNFLSILIECVLVGLIILMAYAMLAIVLIYMERKVCAFFQCRLGRCA